MLSYDFKFREVRKQRRSHATLVRAQPKEQASSLGATIVRGPAVGPVVSRGRQWPKLIGDIPRITGSCEIIVLVAVADATAIVPGWNGMSGDARRCSRGLYRILNSAT